MPRKTKEVEEEKVNKVKAKADTKTTTKKVTTKAITSKKSSSKTVNKTRATSKTMRNKKVTATKTTNTKKSKTSKKEKNPVIEYYDLPYRYNQTVVKILAQTPKMLFAYWDISDEDRKNYEEHFGNDFFSKTKPVLIVHNITMNYSFEVEINDFANSWYLHVNDANCKYVLELGRRPYSYTNTIKQDYIYITSSNEMNSPNNHILFEKFNPNVVYKNVKTNEKLAKDFGKFKNLKNMQKIYHIYDLYKKIYKDDLFKEITEEDKLLNPSSLSSSSFK